MTAHPQAGISEGISEAHWNCSSAINGRHPAQATKLGCTLDGTLAMCVFDLIPSITKPGIAKTNPGIQGWQAC